MSEQQAVSAPGLPGVTVVETSAQPKITVTPTDTTGMSESQARAMRYVDGIKPEILKGGNPWLIAKNREALAHVFHGGPEPAWLESGDAPAKSVDQLVANARAADPDSLAGALAPAFAPIDEQQAARVVDQVVITTGLDRATATDLAGFARELQFSEGATKALLERTAHHRSGGWSDGPVSDEEHDALYGEAARQFGSEEKLMAEATLAQKYLDAVGDQAFLKTIKGSSIVYDPRIISAVAGLARARGITA
jgi:hypothetical protein